MSWGANLPIVSAYITKICIVMAILVQILGGGGGGGGGGEIRNLIGSGGGGGRGAIASLVHPLTTLVVCMTIKLP